MDLSPCFWGEGGVFNFLVLRKLLLVSYCVEVWALFSVYIILLRQLEIAPSATPRKYLLLFHANFVCIVSIRFRQRRLRLVVAGSSLV